MSGRIFTSFTVGRFSIIPAGGPAPDAVDLPIVLGRHGAFGSGEHETTVACLELLTTIPKLQGCHALDLGSGTGILSIAAARLGVKMVVAVDLDQAAVRSCAANVALNDLQGRIQPVWGELAAVADQCYDLVLANIYVDILVPLAAQLVALTRRGGHLLLSGVPLQDKFDLVQCYTALGCRVVDSRIGEDFATYLFVKP